MSKSNYPKFKILSFTLLLLVSCLLFIFAVPASDNGKKTVTANTINFTDSSGVATTTNRFSVLYNQMNLESLGLSHEAFTYGLQGYMDLLSAGEIKNDHILSIVDFSLPSSKKRLFVLDLSTGRLLFNTFVSHGRNSGADMATEFSNDPNSNKSSLGFYVTGDTYKGEHGYSLLLDGKEKGINDNAQERRIVMHAADYVNEAVVKAKGYLGRSLGCPAVPPALHKAIINTIKNGTCLFLYSPDQYYISHSKMIGQPDTLVHLQSGQQDSALPRV
jgi:hypothetical protein